ncbi:hypothetical protein [Brenneria rubrifaciens]|nr:hypothetical protein [Brenneria rubrifaciens]
MEQNYTTHGATREPDGDNRQWRNAEQTGCVIENVNLAGYVLLS